MSQLIKIETKPSEEMKAPEYDNNGLVTKKRRAKSNRNKIPRPKNCFMTYRQDVQHKILAERGRINNKEISKIAGQMWNQEPDSVKFIYRRKAEEGKLEHERLYPDYKYSPKKANKKCQGAPSRTKPSSNNRIVAKSNIVPKIDLHHFPGCRHATQEDYSIHLEQYFSSHDYFPSVCYPVMGLSSSPSNYYPAQFGLIDSTFSLETPNVIENIMNQYVSLDPDLLPPISVYQTQQGTNNMLYQNVYSQFVYPEQ